MTLDMRLLTLVPNHLSTHKLNKNKLHITPVFNTIHNFFTVFPLFCPTTRVEEKEKDEMECGIPHRRWYGEKKVGKSVVERWM